MAEDNAQKNNNSVSLKENVEIQKKEEISREIAQRTEELEMSRSALLNILEDVEEARKVAEEEKNKTLAIITNFADGLLVFNDKKELILVNPQAEKFFDTEGKNLIGKTIAGLAGLPRLEPLVDLLGQGIKKVFREEISIEKKKTLEVSVVSLIREKEQIGIVVILHDITREKMIERMKTDFVSLAAHQLRTPLSAIKWTLKMLLDGDLGKITKKQKDFIEKTYTSNERMIALVNDLLDITRIEEGRYLFKPTSSDIKAIVQFIVAACRPELKRRKVKLEFQKPKGRLPKVMVDVEKIRLAIQNLIENAMKYTPTNGKVTISLRHDKKEVELSVKDTGVGIPEEQKDRIFAKFFRGSNVVRMETEGSGLGLFITKNIIEAHGGKIWFESKKNKGTTFYFTLPI
ncbi:MAG: ATP-binding protein [bacterium]